MALYNITAHVLYSPHRMVGYLLPHKSLSVTGGRAAVLCWSPATQDILVVRLCEDVFAMGIYLALFPLKVSILEW